MSALLRAFLGCMLLAVGVANARELVLPPVDGELSGDFLATKPEGAPPLHWRISAQPAGSNGQRAVTCVVEGAGADVRVEAQVDLAGNGTWRLARARVDLARWLAVATAAGDVPLEKITVTGELVADGDGWLVGGQPSGRLHLRLQNARVEDPDHKLTLEGVALDLMIEDVATWRTARGQRLTWTGGRYDVISFGAGRVIFSAGREHVHVEEAGVGVFGGELTLGAFDFSLSRPEISVVARVVGAEVGRFLPLLPPMVADANGRVDGTLTLHRDESGLQIGDGRLALRSGESAELRLLPTPGLLSSSLPANVKKYYPGLADLEAGKVPLKAELLEISFTPQGDAQGRTASVHLVGGPSDPRLRAPVDLTLNVRGPLEWLVKFGTDSRLRFGSGR